MPKSAGYPAFYDGGMTTEDEMGVSTGEVTWADLLENKYTVNNENKLKIVSKTVLMVIQD